MNLQSLAVSLSVAVGAALFLALGFTPLIRSWFLKLGLADRPDANRKLQRLPISLGGGLAVFLATLIASVLGLIIAQHFGIELRGAYNQRWTLLVAAAGIVLLGLIDDALTLRGRQKLLGQMIIVGFLVASGTIVQRVELLGIPIELGFMAFPLTAVWLLGAINAVNLIDGADGIASTAGSIICASLSVMALLGDLAFEGIVAAAMSAALLGFLCFNWPPAKIYLGDAGSMLIGLVVGVFAIWANLKGSTTIAFSVPIAALTIPLFDSVIAILRRLLTGRSIYSPDRGHLHHQLATRFSPRVMLLIVGSLCLLTGAGAVCSIVLRQQWIALAGAAIVILGLVGTGLFGHAEMRMLAGRLSSFGSSLLTRAHHADDIVREQTHQLQGSRRWDQIWSTLAEFAQRHRLCRLRLDLNLSWQHEGYHGEWRTVRQPERAERWMIHLPVLSQGRLVGKLEVAGRIMGSSSFQSMESLASLLQDLQPLVDRLYAELEGKTDLPTTSSTDTPAEVAALDTESSDEIPVVLDIRQGSVFAS